MAAGARRESIVGAAAGLFARHGYAATTLDEVAAAVGVTKPILYRHFDSKKALYLALLERHEADLPSFMAEPEIPADAPPEEATRLVLDRWLDYVRANQHAWLMLFRDNSGDEEIRAARRRVSLRAREVLAAFVASQAGQLVPAEQVEPTAELLRSGMAGLALWWIDHPEVPKRTVAETIDRFTSVLARASP
jgi:AcrR family transcriptional regulator